MIIGELKNKIDSLWDIFYTGGLTNPLDVIEQMTYLMFIHDLDVSDNTHAKESAMLGLPFESVFSKEVKIGERVIDGTQLKWSVFRDFDAGRMYTVVQEWVFPFIKTLGGDKDSAYTKYMGDAIFKVPTPLMLSRIVDSMDTMYELMEKNIMLNAYYEKNYDKILDLFGNMSYESLRDGLGAITKIDFIEMSGEDLYVSICLANKNCINLNSFSV